MVDFFLSIQSVLHFHKNKHGTGPRLAKWHNIFMQNLKDHWVIRGVGVGLSVDSTTFLQIFYNLRKNTKSTILHDFFKNL